MLKFKNYSIALTLLAFSSLAFAQSNPAQEKLEKVNALIEKNKIDAADEKLVKLLEEHPTFGEGWDLLARIRNYQYGESKKLPDLFSNLTITTTDSTGEEVENDSLGLDLKELFAQMSPEKKAYNNYIHTLRQATLYSEDAYNSSIYLRLANRPDEVDTTIGVKELKYFDKAEEEFHGKNFNKAAKYYQRALDINPNFYKALLYLGDSYYSIGNYTEAIKHFKTCAERFPNFLEPRKYLVDAYFKEGLMELAFQEAVNCMMIYPDLSVKQRLEYAAFELNKQPAFAWNPRLVFPNSLDNDSLTIIDHDKQPEIEGGKNWEVYKESLSKVQDYSNKEGWIEEGNSYYIHKYIELFSWEEMLKEAEEEAFEIAREMKRLDYLDCYIFMSLFHDDLYSQYQHFVKNNRDKIIRYYNEAVFEDRSY